MVNSNSQVVIKYWCLFEGVYFQQKQITAIQPGSLATLPVTLRLPAESQVSQSAEVRALLFLDAHEFFRPTNVFLGLRVGMREFSRAQV